MLNKLITSQNDTDMNIIKKWSNDNPNWKMNPNLANEYFMVYKNMSESDKSTNCKKMLKNIVDNVVLDKDASFNHKIENNIK